MALSKQQWQSKDEFTRPKYQVQVSDTGEESVSITQVVHTIRMGDVEDPYLYAAQPLCEWQNSEVGKWIMEKSVEVPMWHRYQTPSSYHTEYVVQAWLKGSDHTFWQLKWGQKYIDSLIK